ncbi:MAG: HlyU family transcriptional regulator [Sedimenticola sp.]|nr:HlyU family transcriptional regulator [Sedimenticola sp.]
MGIGSLFRSLFSGRRSEEEAASLPAEHYKGFEISADPMPDGGQFRVRGWIRRDGQSHRFIRADLLPTRELCALEVQRKARILIDQQGEELFG